jgi:hypothetical protein
MARLDCLKNQGDGFPDTAVSPDGEKKNNQ